MTPNPLKTAKFFTESRWGIHGHDDTHRHSRREIEERNTASSTSLVHTALDSSSRKAPVPAGGVSSVSSVAGAGVLATHSKFPDTVTADDTPYIGKLRLALDQDWRHGPALPANVILTFGGDANPLIPAATLTTGRQADAHECGRPSGLHPARY